MIEILLAWMGITSVAEGMNCYVYFKLINEIYSAGYKINYNNLLGYSNYLEDNNKYKNIFGKMLIPLVNTKYIDKKNNYFSKNIDEIINILSKYGVIDYMNDQEYNKYLKNPNINTALSITFSNRNEKIEFLKYLLIEMNKIILSMDMDAVNTLILDDGSLIRYILKEENNKKKIIIINSNLINRDNNPDEIEIIKNTYIMLGNMVKNGELDQEYILKYLKDNNRVLDLRNFLISNKYKKYEK